MANQDIITLTCKECGDSATEEQIYLAAAGWKLIRYKYSNKLPYHLCPKHAEAKEKAYLKDKARRMRKT